MQTRRESDRRAAQVCGALAAVVVQNKHAVDENAAAVIRCAEKTVAAGVGDLQFAEPLHIDRRGRAQGRAAAAGRGEVKTIEIRIVTGAVRRPGIVHRRGVTRAHAKKPAGEAVLVDRGQRIELQSAARKRHCTRTQRVIIARSGHARPDGGHARSRDIGRKRPGIDRPITRIRIVHARQRKLCRPRLGVARESVQANAHRRIEIRRDRAAAHGQVARRRQRIRADRVACRIESQGSDGRGCGCIIHQHSPSHPGGGGSIKESIVEIRPQRGGVPIHPGPGIPQYIRVARWIPCLRRGVRLLRKRDRQYGGKNQPRREPLDEMRGKAGAFGGVTGGFTHMGGQVFGRVERAWEVVRGGLSRVQAGRSVGAGQKKNYKSERLSPFPCSSRSHFSSATGNPEAGRPARARRPTAPAV